LVFGALRHIRVKIEDFENGLGVLLDILSGDGGRVE
jgi:hypothetical protein